jgi:AAA domain/AAA domain, putative AbiEii toxin, Type IV TA system
MIESIEIRNFRCFKHQSISGCKRFNVIVGDNDAGKTALLEAIFLTLSGNVEVGVRLRNQRGFDTTFNAPVRAIEEALWRDYFSGLDWDHPITVTLNGIGPSKRTMIISRRRSAPDVVIPFGGLDQKEAAGPLLPITFEWWDASGVLHKAVPKITPQGIQLGVPDEDLPNFFLFPANQMSPASEAAARFSDLSRRRREEEFVEVFSREYPWIENLNIEVFGGLPTIYATIIGSTTKLPVNAVSGGINRILSIMLTLAARPTGVILVDEIENGLYHKHKVGLWRTLLTLARQNNCQMFLTTHDEEWLEALIDASNDEVSDISLWRLERRPDDTCVIRQFSGEEFRSGIETGGEVR